MAPSSSKLLRPPHPPPLHSRTRITQRTKVLPSLRLGDQTSPAISHLDISTAMGRSGKARKKAGSKPWHRIYVSLNLSQLVVGIIPKRIRAIEGAKARLKIARTVKAAGVEWRQIDTNLSAIDDAYSKIRTALRDGYVWRSRSFLLLIVPYVQVFPQLMPNASALILASSLSSSLRVLSSQPVKVHLQIVLSMLIWLS